MPVLGHGARFSRDPGKLMEECRERYGDVFTLKFPGTRRTFLLNPFDWPEYFKHRDMEFEVVGLEFGARVFGYSWADIESCDYPTVRAQVTTLMRGDPLQRMTERMQTKLEESVLRTASSDWQQDSLYRWAGEHVFAAGTDAIFGDGTYDERLKHAFTVVDQHFGLLSMGVPARLLPGVRRAQRELATAVQQSNSGASELMRARDSHFAAHGVKLGRRGLFNASLMWASQANTVPATFWTLLHVLRNPRSRTEILEEVRQFAPAEPPRRPGERLFSKAELKAMVKLDSAIQEINRLTTCPMVPRRVLRDLVLTLHDGRQLQFFEGEELALYIPAAQLDPEIYESPHEFRFDRFLTGDGTAKAWYKNGKRVHFPLIPFGGGKSMCPGRFFAMNEFKITVATLLAWFEIELLSDEVPDFNWARTGFGTYPPVGDVPFRFRLRA
jgi:cytochrome P450